MKKKLLTTLSACVMITLCAQQSSNTELLTHLKNVRTEVKAALAEIPLTEEALKNDWGLDGFLFLLNMFNEINTIDQTSSTLDKEDLYFSMICEMKNMDEVTQAFNYAQLAQELRTAMNNPEDLEKKQAQIAAVFNKHHQAYCMQYPNEFLSDLTVNDIGNPELMLANFCEEGKEFFQKLLLKLDAKIKELEMQV